MQTYVTPFYVSQDYNSSNVSYSNVRVVVNDRVNVNEFTQSFEKRFGTGKQLSKEFQEELSSKLQENFSSIKLSKGEIQESKYLGNTANDSTFYAQQNKYFTDLNDDYILYIKQITISNDYTMNGGGGFYGAGGMRYGGGGSTEYCVITLDVNLINTRKKEVYLRLNVTGKSSVSFFDYQNTLVAALNNSVIHLIGYLKENTVEFDD
jgi:hypothetical protein